MACLQLLPVPIETADDSGEVNYLRAWVHCKYCTELAFDQDVGELRYRAARTALPVSISFECTWAEHFVYVAPADVALLGEGGSSGSRKCRYDLESGKFHCCDSFREGEIVISCNLRYTKIHELLSSGMKVFILSYAGVL